jgi:hypothetical protein
MKIKILVLGLILCFGLLANAQYSNVAEVEKTEKKVLRDPVGFTHLPFLLLRFSPMSAFRYDNILQYGVEIAPPFGKFSFVFDYGKGNGSWAFKKDVKKNYKENSSKVLRGEIRMYFSDWFPFYAMDKKPFGRYYSLEYTNSTFDRVLRVDLADAIKYNVSDLTPYTEKRQDLRVKIGKHFHLHKHLFIDLNAGIGVAQFKTTELESAFTTDLKSEKIGRWSKNYVHGPNQKGFRLSSGIGVNVVVPL